MSHRNLTRLTLAALSAVVVLVAAPAAAVETRYESFTITSPTPAVKATLGVSVAFDGRIIVAGATGETDAGPNTGAVYLFDVTTGEMLHRLTAPVPTEGEAFGRAVDIDAGRVIVTAPMSGTIGTKHAYVFDVDSGSRLQQLSANGVASFGPSVALSGNRALIGTSQSNSLYLYDIDTGQRIPHEPQGAGGVVALSSDYLVVGGLNYGPNPGGSTVPYSGFIRIDNLADSGTAYHYLQAPTPTSFDGFGGALALDGSKLIVGAQQGHAAYPGPGAAYIFDLSTSDSPTVLLPPTEIPTRYFGRSVAIDGSLAVIGANQEDGNPNSSLGVAFVYDVPSGDLLYALRTSDLADGDIFGEFLAIRGETIIAGAPGHDGLGEDAGLLYVFNSPKPSLFPPQVVGVDVGGLTWGNNGYAIPLGTTDQSLPLPHTRINQISLTFGEHVTFGDEQAVLVDSAGNEYTLFGPLVAPGAQPGTYKATWQTETFLDLGRYTLRLGDGVVDDDGHALDGEWTNDASAASGDGEPGGEFVFAFNVLPGDVNQDGIVNLFDLIAIRNSQGATASGETYSPLHDIDASGAINLTDVLLSGGRLFDVLPPLPAASAAAVPEPSSLILPALAISALVVVRYRRPPFVKSP